MSIAGYGETSNIVTNIKLKPKIYTVPIITPHLLTELKSQKHHNPQQMHYLIYITYTSTNTNPDAQPASNPTGDQAHALLHCGLNKHLQERE